ncbi:MAG: FecR domain-containing protein, partial [Odoribacter sp.]|nr:FecR domain-containing protein [Odoribacter sp.]
AGEESKLMNTVRTLTGMEYALTLSDGTKVYLNAESEIRFPLVFNDKQRVVEISGEVYFEVAKNVACPFIVKTRDLSVKVLGTSFNVRTYDNDRDVFVTLADGKVQVFNGFQFADLVPGEQAVYGKTTKTLAVNRVDVSRCMAWRNGMFIFRNERLEDIINYLARWYDVKYRFMDNRIKDVRIGAKLDRYADMNPIIEMLTVNPAISVTLDNGVYCIASK